MPVFIKLARVINITMNEYLPIHSSTILATRLYLYLLVIDVKASTFVF